MYTCNLQHCLVLFQPLDHMGLAHTDLVLQHKSDLHTHIPFHILAHNLDLSAIFKLKKSNCTKASFAIPCSSHNQMSEGMLIMLK